MLFSVGGWKPSGATNRARALGGAGDFALGAIAELGDGLRQPRWQQHDDGEILRSQYILRCQYEAIFLILGNLQTSSNDSAV